MWQYGYNLGGRIKKPSTKHLQDSYWYWLFVLNELETSVYINKNY